MKTMLIGLAALAALAAAGAGEAGAQQRSPANGPRVTLPGTAGHYDGGRWGGRRGHGKHRGGFFPGFVVVDREVPVIVEREVVREVVKEVAAEPPPPPRKPFAVGASYASLPGGCMKMIEGSASYYYCGGGEWYQPEGKQYRAVAAP